MPHSKPFFMEPPLPFPTKGGEWDNKISSRSDRLRCVRSVAAHPELRGPLAFNTIAA